MSVNTIVVSRRSASEPPRTPVMNSSISSSIGAVSPTQYSASSPGQFDEARSGDALGEVVRVLDGLNVRVVAMQDQRRHGDARAAVADVGLPDLLDEGTGHAG